jgi:hypothetical protein
MDISINRIVLLKTILTKNKFPIDYSKFGSDIIDYIHALLQYCRAITELQERYNRVSIEEEKVLRSIVSQSVLAA